MYIYQSIHCDHTRCISRKACKRFSCMHVSLSRLHGMLLHILCKSVFMNYFVAKECDDMLKATSGDNTKKVHTVVHAVNFL